METPTTTPIYSILASDDQFYSELYSTWLKSIPEEYRDMPLKNCLEIPPQIVSFGTEWAAEKYPCSLYLTGGFGSGKTTFAFALIREFLKNINGKFYFWPRYFTGRQLDTLLLKATKHEDGDEWQLSDLADTDLLFIDDIDKVTGTDRFKTQIFELINRRYLNRKPTIITSNMSPSEMTSLFDGSVISRIRDVKKWKTIKFPEKDLRSSKKPIL